ncbi:Ribosomal RNA small subunit methyltransferase E [Halioglobus japonicus]|nr:Ribosomal RNA small subunit methyltransferase E [Halioglobus japonicus]
MRITRIYSTQKLGSHTTVGLEPGPSRHLARVLRLGVGDHLILFDGHGGEYPGEITAVDKKQVEVRTGEHREIESESPLAIHLGIAVSRGERMDWLIQKSTELGVTALTPLLTEHTGVKLSGERATKKIQHWQQIAISACEQCGRNRPPEIHALQSAEQWLGSTVAEQKFVLHHRADTIDASRSSPGSIALLVGPEGGLSEAEITAAEQAGYTALRLGPRVLRTETAPLAAIAILQAYWGDMTPG